MRMHGLRRVNISMRPLNDSTIMVLSLRIKWLVRFFYHKTSTMLVLQTFTPLHKDIQQVLSV